MLLFLFIISCFSFIIFYNSIHLKHFLHWTSEMRFVSLFFYKDSAILAITRFMKTSILSSLFSAILRMSFENKSISSKVVNWSDSYSCVHSSSGCSNIPNVGLLDLPDLVLESIIDRLPLEGLLNMTNVCSSMQEICMSHIKHKWGKVLGPSAYRKWQFDIVYLKESNFSNQTKQKGLINYLSKLWPVSLVRSSRNLSNSMMMKNYNSIDSFMCWYLALESGNLWFPAQVYNRENGDFGFMLSCYDAELCYDHKTDTFQARYRPHGRNNFFVETGVTWDRVRSASIDNHPFRIHNSDCLNELRPGDHIEIQWRKNKGCPYGWSYGVVGHLELCKGNGNYCMCAESDIISLKFNQYAPGTRWIKTIIRRKHQKEEGNATDGFFAGIRKLKGLEEISRWNHLAALLE